MKEILEYIAKALVDDPSQVDVKEIVGEKVTIYELKVSKSDIGKIIGKRGRTAGALRTILNAVSTKQGKRSELEIVE
ncbi:MAG: KH domain-containing protein [Candidatus Cloacimonetes bacterium]|nr:KH domain-containing protein [Candidatus Cloacimonadota bacterium]